MTITLLPFQGYIINIKTVISISNTCYIVYCSLHFENQETKKMLEEWKLAFNRDLVQLRARLMEPVEIRGAGSSKFKYKVENADWSPAFRNWKQWTVVECKKWAVIVSRIIYFKSGSQLYVSAPTQCQGFNMGVHTSHD